MNKLFHIIISIVTANTFCVQPLIGQTKNDIFNKDIPLTWMGVDFTQARYSGEPGKESYAEMREQFAKINLLILQESGKYDLEKIFHKSRVVTDIEPVQLRNHSIDPDNIPAAAYGQLNRLDPEILSEIIKNYYTGRVTGLAAVMIMEDMNKKWEQASMWIVYFNAGTKEVLLTSRLVGEASGLGFRNHWAASVHEALKKLKSQEYNKWVKSNTRKK